VTDHGDAAASAAPAAWSVGSVLADSVATYGREWRPLVALAALIEVPLVLAELVWHVTPTLRELRDGEGLAGLIALLALYGSLSHHFLAGVIERVVAADRHGHRRPTVGEVLRHLPWQRLVVADVLLTAGIFLGLATFVVPGIVVATWFALALPIINLEGRSVRAGFGRSYRLVRGHSWRVGAIAVGAFVLPSAVVGAVGLLTHTGDHVADALLHAVPATIVLPLASLPLVITAFDLVALHPADDAGGAGDLGVPRSISP
jgi:hypothetical protein